MNSVSIGWLRLTTFISLCVSFSGCSGVESSYHESDKYKMRYKADSALFAVITNIQNEVGQNFSGDSRSGDAIGSCRIRLIRGVDTALINAEVSVSFVFEHFGENYHQSKRSAREEYAFFDFKPVSSSELGLLDEYTKNFFPVVFKGNASGKSYGKHSNAFFGIDTVNKQLVCIIRGHNSNFRYYGYLPLNKKLVAKAKASFNELYPETMLVTSNDCEIKADDLSYMDNGYGRHPFMTPQRDLSLELYRIFSASHIDSLHQEYEFKTESFYEIMFFPKKEFWCGSVLWYVGDVYNGDSILVTENCFITSDDPWVQFENWPLDVT